jgi:hypothetical protein
MGRQMLARGERSEPLETAHYPWALKGPKTERATTETLRITPHENNAECCRGWGNSAIPTGWTACA